MPPDFRPLLHQTPTHADTEDRFLFGLTGRQFLLAVVSVVLAYGLWDWLGPSWPPLLRAIPPVLLAAMGLTVAFARPGGHSFWEYAFLRLRAAMIPRVTVWRPSRRDW
jgi:hypothetical protein